MKASDLIVILESMINTVGDHTVFFVTDDGLPPYRVAYASPLFTEKGVEGIELYPVD
jgi:hypothetical protein